MSSHPSQDGDGVNIRRLHDFGGGLEIGERLALTSSEGAEALLMAGTPHGEPIAHYGPFVMNAHDELEQALREYHAGTLTG